METAKVSSDEPPSVPGEAVAIAARPASQPVWLAIFALTIFWSAFLLFQVQPLIAKFILPWFGGGPGVWTTCLLFFQVLLLGGYTYAHISVRWFVPPWPSLV